MSRDTVFLLVSYGVLPFWGLLVVAPGWVWTQRLVHSLYPCAALAALYVGLLFFGGGAAPEGASLFTFEGVQLLFSDGTAVLIGWVHYLCFDLMVGAWEARDAQQRGVPQWVLAPCLVGTLMLGPLGLLVYLVARAAHARTTANADG